MKNLILIFCIPFYMKATYPDTTKIPAKWKKESVIVLEHIYRANEITDDHFKFRINNRIVYYIRDKYGLDQLSTFNLPVKIVEGAESQIGKVFKRNGEVIELTTKNLIPNHYKVDVGNRRKRRSTYKGESDQKLAVPRLEVGDIIELDYWANEKDFIYYLYLNPRYNTIKYEINYEVNSSNTYIGQYGAYSVNSELQCKIFNYPESKVTLNPQTINIEQQFVERIEEQTLSDDNYTYPYIITWKTNKSNDDDENKVKYKKYVDLTQDQARDLQKKYINAFYPIQPSTYYDENAYSYLGAYTENVFEKKYEKIKDTLAFLNDLFYMVRELKALNNLNQRDYYTTEKSRDDKYYVNVFSNILYNHKIPYQIFLTQNNYYGKFECENDFMFPRYGIWIPRFDYYFFNPFDESFANRIPSVLENHSFFSFKDYHFLFSGKKKEKDFKFTVHQFPEGNRNKNFIRSEIELTNINPEKNLCTVNIEIAYGGHNKDNYCTSLCSKTQSYEREDNPIQEEIKKANKKYETLNYDAEEADRLLKKFIIDDFNGDGMEVEKINSTSLIDSKFAQADAATKLGMNYDNNLAICKNNNYLFIKLSYLMGTQIFYKERNEERHQDFYSNHEKQYRYYFRINLPDGYKPVNLESFNTKITNGAGEFISTATLKGNILEITAVKNYDFKMYPKEKANDVVSFLNAATQFYNSRVVLVKM